MRTKLPILLAVALLPGVVQATESITLHSSPKRHLEAVLRAAANMRRSGDSEESWKAFDAAFDPVLN